MIIRTPFVFPTGNPEWLILLCVIGVLGFMAQVSFHVILTIVRTRKGLIFFLLDVFDHGSSAWSRREGGYGSLYSGRLCFPNLMKRTFLTSNDSSSLLWFSNLSFSTPVLLRSPCLELLWSSSLLYMLLWVVLCSFHGLLWRNYGTDDRSGAFSFFWYRWLKILRNVRRLSQVNLNMGQKIRIRSGHGCYPRRTMTGVSHRAPKRDSSPLFS